MEMKERISVTIVNSTPMSVEMNKETAYWVVAFVEGFKDSVRRCSKRMPRDFKERLGESIANTYSNYSAAMTDDYEEFFYMVACRVEMLTGICIY